MGEGNSKYTFHCAGCSGADLLQGSSMLLCGVAFGGPLAFLLRHLLQNDSLLDIGRRSDLYWGTVRLVQSLGEVPGTDFAILSFGVVQQGRGSVDLCQSF